MTPASRHASRAAMLEHTVDSFCAPQPPHTVHIAGFLAEEVSDDDDDDVDEQQQQQQQHSGPTTSSTATAGATSARSATCEACLLPRVRVWRWWCLAGSRVSVLSVHLLAALRNGCLSCSTPIVAY